MHLHPNRAECLAQLMPLHLSSISMRLGSVVAPVHGIITVRARTHTVGCYRDMETELTTGLLGLCLMGAISAS